MPGLHDPTLGSIQEQSLFGHLSYMNPFFDYSSIFQPAIFHNALRWCHVEGTLIETEADVLTPIQDIRVGDRVWSSLGWKEVLNTFVRHYDGHLTRVKAAGVPDLTLTPDHRVYVWREGRLETIAAAEIQVGDWMVTPVRQPSPRRVSHTNETIDLIESALSTPHGDSAKEVYHQLFIRVLNEHFGGAWHCDSLPLEHLALGYLICRLAEAAGHVSEFDGTSFHVHADPNEDIIIQSGLVCRKVLQVEHDIPFSGNVYSLTVQDAYNYVANGLLVRNCEYVVTSNGLLRSALRRVISFFVTDIVVEGVDREKRRQYYEYLIRELGLVEKLRVISMDYITYGNIVLSLVEPFKRVLHCEQCGTTFSLMSRPLTEKFVFRDGYFHGTCVKGHSARFRFMDHPIRTGKGIRIKRWSIYELNLDYDPFSEEARLIWRIPKEYKSSLQNGELLKVANAPVDVLTAVDQDADLLLHPDVVFFGRDESLVGIKMRGWGLSRIFTVMRHAWNFQVLHRMHEAIGLDYTAPLRIITPAPRPGAEGGDPISTINMSNFVQTLGMIIEARRRDPTIWHVSPYPIQYQPIGGDGRQFAPRELFEHAADVLLNSADVPMDFYKGTLTLQAAPLGLRIMESMWSDMFQLNNRFLMWLSKRLADLLKWDESVTIQLAQPRHLDDINRQMAKVQLMMSGALSKGEVLRSFGIDLETDIKQRMEEQVLEMKESQKIQEQLEGAEMAQMMAAGQGPGMPGDGMPPGGAPGGAPPGGAPAGGGPAPPMGAPQPGGAPPMMGDPVDQILAQVPPATQFQKIDPQELDQYATQLAQHLFSMDATMRNSALRRLQARNETLWMMVKERLREMMVSAQRQGVIAARQQGGGGGGPPPM